MCKLLCIYKLWYLTDTSGGWGRGGGRRGRFDFVPRFAIIYPSRAHEVLGTINLQFVGHLENETMSKKTTATVTPAPAADLTEFQAAIANDIKSAVISMTSGRKVAAAYDARFPFNWTLFKGNKKAETCGMSAEEYKAVRDARIEYRDAWNNATDEDGNPVKLYSFDRRWQYITETSTHAPEAEESEAEESESDAASAKTKAEQCLAALQNALRYATHEEFDGNICTAETIREAMKLNGWTEAE